MSHEPDDWERNAEVHVRSKTMPKYRDVDYLHYADLNDFLKSQATDAPITILDYGAGASPYKKYFPNSDYRRADVTGSQRLDYQLGHDSTVAEADGVFDLILSTQVAEHLQQPDLYFKECFRLLKKGGRLVVTTHGIWEEHGSPYDFQRWVEEGMRRDVKGGGFTGVQIYKVTCGFRATLLLFTRGLFSASPPTGAGRRFVFKLVRWTYSRLYPLLHRIIDKWWPQDRVFKTEPGQPSPIWYIVIAVVAQK